MLSVGFNALNIILNWTSLHCFTPGSAVFNVLFDQLHAYDRQQQAILFKGVNVMGSYTTNQSLALTLTLNLNKNCFLFKSQK